MSTASQTVSLLIVGVGGQGAITLAQVLGEAAMRQGRAVRVGQLHGMSQRGGSVESTVVLGPGQSAFLPLRGADLVLGLEPLELLRARPRMHRGSRVVASSGKIVPTPMALSGAEYPEPAHIFGQIRPLVDQLLIIDGPAVAGGVGAIRALNAVMLGALTAQAWLPFDAGAVLEALARRSAPEHLESNRRAFQAGREAVSS